MRTHNHDSGVSHLWVWKPTITIRINPSTKHRRLWKFSKIPVTSPCSVCRYIAHTVPTSQSKRAVFEVEQLPGTMAESAHQCMQINNHLYKRDQSFLHAQHVRSFNLNSHIVHEYLKWTPAVPPFGFCAVVVLAAPDGVVSGVFCWFAVFTHNLFIYNQVQ